MEKSYNNVKSTVKSDKNSQTVSVYASDATSTAVEKGRNHRLEIDGHQLISVWGVKGVPTFGDKEVKIQLDGESLFLTGQNLEIKLLDLEKGQLIIKGYVLGLRYTSGSIEKGMLKRIFK